MKVKNKGVRPIAFNGILFAVGEEKEVENVKRDELPPNLVATEIKKSNKGGN